MMVECPPGQNCQVDDKGNEYYLDGAGAVVYTGTIAAVVNVGTKTVVESLPGNTPIIGEKFWENTPWWKRALNKVGEGFVKVGKVGGAAFFILTNPTSTGCGASPGMVSNGNGGCVYDPNLDTSTIIVEMSDNPKEKPTEEQTPSDTKKKKDKKKKEKKKKKERTIDGAVDQLTGIEKAQDFYRKGARKRPIDSIEKSKQNLKRELDKLKGRPLEDIDN